MHINKFLSNSDLCGIKLIGLRSHYEWPGGRWVIAMIKKTVPQELAFIAADKYLQSCIFQ